MADLPANPSAASERPLIQTFQLDTGTVGNIARSVNMFRGNVNIPLTLASLPGRNGLALEVTALYASNVTEQTGTWNASAGTSVLGSGWSIAVNRIFVDGKNTGEATDGIYFLQWNGAVDRLIWRGEDDGEVLFQCRQHPLWQVRYTAASESWRVVLENGNTAVFGGADPSRHLLLYGVRWNNWIGATLVDSPQPQQLVVAWNLASIRSPWDDGLTYSYYADEPAITAGVTYTRASYLAAIEDMLGQRVTLGYAPKESFEYVPPHQLADGSPDPAYQDRYETLFLQSLDVSLAGNDETEYSMELGYALFDASGQAGNLFVKRYLTSVTQHSRGLRALPPMEFEYQRDAARPNPGGLTRITFPEGGVVDYGYDRITLNPGTEDDIFLKNIEVANPIAGSRPLVWHGPGYVVLAWYSDAKATMRLQIYTFAGRWSAPFEMDIDGRIELDGTRITLQDQFFALFLAAADSDQVKLRLFERVDYRFGEWRRTDLSLTTGNVIAAETTLASGNDFIVLHAGGDTVIHRWTYDRTTLQWRHDEHNAGTTRVPLAAELNYYIAAYYSNSARSATYQLFYRDVAGAWTAGKVGPSGPTFDWEPAYATGYWSLGSSFAVGGYFPAGSSAPRLRILMWDTTFAVLHDKTFAGAELPARVAGSTVGSGNVLYRFDGAQWKSTTVATSDVTEYAYGDDVALISRISGSGVSTTLARYVADSAQWVLRSAAGDAAPAFAAAPAPKRRRRRGDVSVRARKRNEALAAATLQVYRPTISGDILTNDAEIRRRTPKGEWEIIGSLPADAAKDSLQNRGPEYLAFENKPKDVRDTATTIYLLKNGQLDSTFQLPKERILTDDAVLPGAALAGGRCFVTFPAGEIITSPTKVYLHRILNHELSNVQTDDVAVSVSIDNGYETTTTTYAYDAETAVFDTSGEVVQYPSVTERWLDDDGEPAGGYRENVFYNGLPKADAPLDVRAAEGDTNADDYYSLLAGYPRLTRTYNADGMEVNTQTDTWGAQPILYGDASPIGVLVPAAQAALVQTRRLDSALQLFPLPSSVSSDFDDGIIPTSVRETFDERGLPLPDDSTVAAVVAGEWWTIAAGTASYVVRRRPDDLMVFGSITSVTDSAYDPATAFLLASTTSNYDSGGNEQTIEESTLYAWRVAAYEGLKAARMLTAVAESRQTNRTAAVTMAASAATYRSEWGSKSVWASEASYEWRGPSAEAPAFDFGVGASNPEWLRTAAVLTRNAHGQEVVADQVLGPVSSVLYDRSGYWTVAAMTNVDLSAGRQATYLGFESYEDLQGWHTDGSTPIETLITDAQAHTGAQSLRLPPGGPRVSNTFAVPSSKGSVLFAAWVRTDPGYTSGAAWTIEAGGTSSESVVIPDTGGAWSQLWKYLTLPQPAGDVAVTVSLTNAASAAVYVDDVRLTPLACSLSAQVYDPDTYFVIAELDETGATDHLINDPFGRLIATIGPKEEVTALHSSWYSRDGHAAFDPSDPNMTLTIGAADGGFLDDFHDGTFEGRWSSPDPSHWAVAGDAVVHVVDGEDTLTLRDSTDFADYGVRLELDYGEPVTAPLGLRVAGSFTVQWTAVPGTWQLLDASGSVLAEFAQQTLAPGSWLLVAGTHGVLFFLNGRQILAHYFDAPVGGALELFAGSPGTSFGQIFVFRSPRVAARYVDASSNDRQEQALGDDGTVVGGTVYDPLNRPAITTKKMLYAKGVLGYRTQFVESIDWTTGVMTGELSDYYSGGEQSNDEGYPYQRNRFAPGPTEVPLESGLPGSTLAIRPGNTHTIRYEYLIKTNDGFLDTLPAGEYRLNRIIDGDGTMQETIADKLGNEIGSRTIAAAGTERARSSFELDARGNLTATYPPNFYDPPQGADPASFVLTQEVDVAGNVIRNTSPDSGATELVYDDADRLRFTLTADGRATGGNGKDRIIYQCYDVLGRMSEQGVVDAVWDRKELEQKADTSWPAGETPGWTFRYEYDGDGSSIQQAGRLFRTLQNEPDEVVAQRIGYDAAGNVTEAATEAEASDSYTVAYGYDIAGDLTAVTYPRDAGNVTYAYDALGQMSAIGNETAADRYATYTYAASGSLETATRDPRGANPILRRYRYNSPGWPYEVRSDAFTERIAYYEETGYDGARYYNGQTARVTTESASATYSWLNAYDEDGRLATAENTVDGAYSLGTGGHPLLYDANGNVLSYGDGGTERTYDYATGTNRLRSVDGGAPFSYDDDGATVAMPGGDALTYDPVTLLTRSVTRADGTRIDLRYAPGGARRIKRVTRGSSLLYECRYLSSALGGPLVEETSGESGERRLVYVVGPDGLVSFTFNGVETSVLSDTLGSPRVVLSKDGQVLAAFNFRPFGEAMGDPDFDVLRYRFTGQEFDPETGLYNFNARLYAPDLFRFLRTDPAKAGFGPYTYAENDPFGLTDPSGELAFLAALLVAVAVGAAVGAVAGGAGYAIEVAVSDDKKFNWGEFGIAVGIGAAAGAIGGAVGFGAGAAVSAGFAAAGIGASGAVVGAVSGAAGGAAGGFSGQVLGNVAAGREWHENWWQGTLIGAGTGALLGGAGGALARGGRINYQTTPNARANFTNARDNQRFFGIVTRSTTRNGRVLGNNRGQLHIAKSGPDLGGGASQIRNAAQDVLIGRGRTLGHGRMAGWLDTPGAGAPTNRMLGFGVQRVSNTTARFQWNSGVLNPRHNFMGSRALPFDQRIAILRGYSAAGIRSASLVDRSMLYLAS